MANDSASKLAAAKSTLADANKRFPSPKPATPASKSASVAPSPKPAPLTDSTIGPSLRAKQENINSYINNTPKMHKGGEVPEDGVYNMKAGEHVITAKQKQSMMKGMKALMKPAKPMGAGPIPGNGSTHETNVRTLGAAKSAAAQHDNKIKK